ncbi:MAG: hypothetical protein HY960_14970 [Ignavibacteriae bacterium]|nr:hypothetical protein [Ignavibacteriota bacterium]
MDSTDYYRTNGLETTVCYWMTWVDSLNMLASFADLLMKKSTDGGNSWSFDYSGLFAKKHNDISMIVKHPVTNYYYAAVGDVVGSNGDFTDTRLKLVPGRISYSTNNGQNWNILYDFKKTVSWLALDPNNLNRMYATIKDTLGGIGGVYVCNNIIDSSMFWHPLSAPARTQGRANSIHVLDDGTLVCTYSARDTNTYDFSASAGVFTSTDGGSTWMDSTTSGMMYSVHNLEIDPNDNSQNTWLAFVTANGAGQPGAYRTTNRGANWTKIYSGSSYSCTFHPVIPNEMYLCTESNGLFYVTNTNSNSPSFVSLSDYPFKGPTRAFFNPYDLNTVWVMSMGNGMRYGNAYHQVHSITASAGTNGTISPSGKVFVGDGLSKAFTFYPDSGYQLDSVIVDGVTVPSSSSYTFTNVTGNHSLVVTFKPAAFIITTSTNGNGRIFPSGNIPVDAGETHSFTIIPSPDFMIDSVIVDGVNMGSLFDVSFSNIQASHSINAIFKISSIQSGNTANPNTLSSTQCIRNTIDSLMYSPAKRVISGQYLNVAFPASAAFDSEVVSLYNQTNKWVGLIGMNYQKTVSGYPTNLSSVNQPLIDYFHAGGLVVIMCQFSNPWTNNFSNDTTHQSQLLDLITPGTPVYVEWIRRLDSVAIGLRQLQDSGVTVLFRPFHEMNATWFWWGSTGATTPSSDDWTAIWIHMFNYFTYTKQLNNLLWVYSPSVRESYINSSSFKTELYYYPGNNNVDIIGVDAYSDTLDIPNYSALLAKGKPLAISEFGMKSNLSTPFSYDYSTLIHQIKTKYPAFRYWMSWNDFTNTNNVHKYYSLRSQNSTSLLNDDWVINRNDMNLTCDPSAIVNMNMTYQKNWNIVSFPLDGNDFGTNVLFPSASSGAFMFANGYVMKDTLEKGIGYWIKFDSTTSLTFSGTRRMSDTVLVTSGWNLIGMISSPVAISTITTEPPGIISSNYFGYDLGYVEAQILYPGKGYWVKFTQDGVLIFK